MVERPAPPTDDAQTAPQRTRHHRWSDLMRRAFAIDVLRCPRCSASMRFVANIDSPEAIRRILTHLGLPSSLPRPRPARAPPGLTPDLFDDFPAA